MSRDILIPLAIACDNVTCGACRNLVGGRCNVFGERPRVLKKTFSEHPERLPQCLEAERFAKGDWEARMRASLVNDGGRDD